MTQQERAARYLAKLPAAVAGQGGSATGWRPGYVGGKGQDGVWQRIIGQMPPHSIYVEAFAGSAAIFFHKRPAARSILIDRSASVLTQLAASAPAHGDGQSVEVIQVDALDWLLKTRLPADALIYCDPPYLLNTRSGRRYYNHELTGPDHLDLLRTLRRLNCRVLISGYPSGLYASSLHDWRCLSYRCRTRGRTVTECLWMNFPEPTELHDWRFAGRNFRERLALRRLAARWLARLQAMPPRKRGYVWNALTDPETPEPARPDRVVPVLATMTAGLNL